MLTKPVRQQGGKSCVMMLRRTAESQDIKVGHVKTARWDGLLRKMAIDIANLWHCWPTLVLLSTAVLEGSK